MRQKIDSLASDQRSARDVELRGNGRSGDGFGEVEASEGRRRRRVERDRGTRTEEWLTDWNEAEMAAETDKLSKTIDRLETEKEALQRRLEKAEKAVKAERKTAEQTKADLLGCQDNFKRSGKPTRYGAKDRQKRGLARKSQDRRSETKEIPYWTSDEVCAWLSSIGMSEYGSTFRKNDIQGSELMHLERSDILEIGINKIGYVKRLQSAILELKAHNQRARRAQARKKRPVAKDYKPEAAAGGSADKRKESSAERYPLLECLISISLY
ncbi:unnamed protein product [Caenorhabditis sp. 36 PRJEB53466]|nr:unnamed protein product [Caenorhabditis sp. 36 PRJEB53466]